MHQNMIAAEALPWTPLEKLMLPQIR